MREVVYVNGELVAAVEATIPIGDHGLTVGDGLFETMKVTGGTAFALTRHLRRLRRTAAGMGLRDVPAEEVLRDAVERTIAANGAGVGRARLMVTGGIGPAGTQRGEGGPTVIVMCGPPSSWSETATVITVEWPRNERGALAGLKSTSYAENVIALQSAHARGADEAIFPNTVGNLCEGTGSNVFLALDGSLLTPPLSSGCLPGVTRELLLEVLDVEEPDVPIGALRSAPEAFLTSSTRDIQPIAVVDGERLAAAPGPRTREAIEAFTAISARTLDP